MTPIILPRLPESLWVKKLTLPVIALATALALEKHPDKTFIGRTERGFDFLGYHVSPAAGLTVARQTVTRVVTRVTRLYEQERPEGPSALGDYVRR